MPATPGAFLVKLYRHVTGTMVDNGYRMVAAFRPARIMGLPVFFWDRVTASAAAEGQLHLFRIHAGDEMIAHVPDLFIFARLQKLLIKAQGRAELVQTLECPAQTENNGP